MVKKVNVKKEDENLEPPNDRMVSWGSAYVMSRNIPDRMCGQLYQLIETMGLSEKQETAVKETIKEIIWNNIENHAVRVSSEIHNNIREKWYDNGKGFVKKL